MPLTSLLIPNCMLKVERLGLAAMSIGIARRYIQLFVAIHFFSYVRI